MGHKEVPVTHLRKMMLEELKRRITSLPVESRTAAEIVA